MVRCAFVDRECIKDCIAYDDSKEFKCLVLHMSDRTNRLLNFIEKKVDKK
jgi:hypothetical protein